MSTHKNSIPDYFKGQRQEMAKGLDLLKKEDERLLGSKGSDIRHKSLPKRKTKLAL